MTNGAATGGVKKPFHRYSHVRYSVPNYRETTNKTALLPATNHLQSCNDSISKCRSSASCLASWEIAQDFKTDLKVPKKYGNCTLALQEETQWSLPCRSFRGNTNMSSQFTPMRVTCIVKPKDIQLCSQWIRGIVVPNYPKMNLTKTGFFYPIASPDGHLRKLMTNWSNIPEQPMHMYKLRALLTWRLSTFIVTRTSARRRLLHTYIWFERF